MKKPVSRQGDMHSCPVKGHGTTPIISASSMLIVDGKLGACVGDKTGCGATIIEGAPIALANNKFVTFVGAKTSHGGTIISGSTSMMVDTSASRIITTIEENNTLQKSHHAPGIINDKSEKPDLVPITIVNQCNDSPHANCTPQPVINAKLLIDGVLNGETDKNGFLILKGENIIGKTLTIKHKVYKDKRIIISRWGENIVQLSYNRKNLRHEINTSLKIRERNQWSDKTINTSKLHEHWCYSMITIHHAGDGDIDTPEEIEEKHMGERCTFCFSSPNEWDDIGYHYFIESTGQIYEAREIGYKGEHVKMNNSYKIGINFLGDYNSEGFLKSAHDTPTAKQIDSCITLVNKLKKYFPLTELGGHKDYALDSDAICPGNLLYEKLDYLRQSTDLKKPKHYHKTHARIEYKACE